MRKSMQLSNGPLRFAATVLTAACLFVPTANAQAPKPSSPSPGALDQSSSIPDQKLDAAAAALGKVASIKQNYQQRMESADPTERQSLANEANNALVKAVTDEGLSVDEYTRIMVIAQNDPGIRERILRRLGPADEK